MRKNSLSSKGLSLSQAKSISNICNQRSLEISNKIERCNVSSRTVKIGDEDFKQIEAIPLPKNLKDLILEKSSLHATQAFLMENIKAKDEIINKEKGGIFIYEGIQPEYPDLEVAPYIEHIDEEWGWGQLTNDEYNEYLEAESYAAHIGQFIHKDGKLSKMRSILNDLNLLDFIEIEVGKKTPVRIVPHHTSEELLEIYENLAGLHRQYEQKVNYYKAKVKNLKTLENARISKENSVLSENVEKNNRILLDGYRIKNSEFLNLKNTASQLFEEKRQVNINEFSKLRIEVPARFQSIIDDILKDIETKEEE
jgi:hypothetical protein